MTASSVAGTVALNGLRRFCSSHLSSLGEYFNTGSDATSGSTSGSAATSSATGSSVGAGASSRVPKISSTCGNQAERKFQAA